jgi:hypothetical protein
MYASGIVSVGLLSVEVKKQCKGMSMFNLCFVTSSMAVGQPLHSIAVGKQKRW